MIIEDSFEQRSFEWHMARLGIPTASRFSEIISPGGKPSKSAEGYAYELAADRHLGYADETYVSYDMQRGIDLEPEARFVYGGKAGMNVQEVALVYKNAQKNVSCSPDGLITKPFANIPFKGLEIQCPKRKNHVRRMLKRDLPYEKLVQFQGSMWVCGFSEWDFVSYYPGLELVVIPVKRDPGFCQKLEAEMIKFLRELKNVYAKLKGKVG